jgi:hypothetical protein
VEKKITIKIAIECGNIKVPPQFEVEIVHENYYNFIERYHELYNILCEIYEKVHTDKFIEILHDYISFYTPDRYYNAASIDGLPERGTLFKGNVLGIGPFYKDSKAQFKDYRWEGEILQVMEFVYNNTPFKWNVVDFNDEIIGTCKTYSEAQKLFQKQYPYMDLNLIKHFIDEI